jgi:hypothetical protein
MDCAQRLFDALQLRHQLLAALAEQLHRGAEGLAQAGHLDRAAGQLGR